MPIDILLGIKRTCSASVDSSLEKELSVILDP